MKHLLLLLAIIVVASCGKHKDIPDAMTPNQALAAKLARYTQSVQPVELTFADDSDGLLFASLTAAGTGQTFAVERWEGKPGEFFRNPDHAKCKPTSRDMYIGLMWYMWAAKRVDLAERVFDYGLDHVFVMDARDKGTSYLLEDEQFTLALVAHRLGGKDYTVWKLPTPCTSKLSGFEAHLQSLVIGLRALLDAGDTVNEKCAKDLAAGQPNNAWFAAVAGLYSGDQTHTVEMLLDPRYCPDDRLPESKDRCEPWLWQRDEQPKDWEPCPNERKTHSGGDCALSMAVALGGLR